MSKSLDWPSSSAFVVATLMTLYTVSLQAASSCYNESNFPSVLKLEETSAGIRAYLGGKYYDYRTTKSRTVLYTKKTGWIQDGQAYCRMGFTGYCEQHDITGCRYNIPASALCEQASAAFPDRVKGCSPLGFEQKVSVCTEHDGAVYFGISFYQGEGSWGIGGIGRYYPQTREVQIKRPRLLRNSSINQIVHDGHSLWLGTTGHYECIGLPATEGLVRFQWETGGIETRTSRYNRGPCGFVVHGFISNDQEFWVATDLGVSMFKRHGPTGREWKHFVPDLNASPVMRETTCEALYTELLDSLPSKSNGVDDPPYSLLFQNLVKFRPDFLEQYMTNRTKKKSP